jgi:hypothetical protein
MVPFGLSVRIQGWRWCRSMVEGREGVNAGRGPGHHEPAQAALDTLRDAHVTVIEHRSRVVARPGTAPIPGAAIRSTPNSLIRIRYPPPSGSSPRTDNPPWPVPTRDAKPPENVAPRADEGPETSPIPGRGLACLTAHEPSRTMPLDEKGSKRNRQMGSPDYCLIRRGFKQWPLAIMSICRRSSRE